MLKPTIRLLLAGLLAAGLMLPKAPAAFAQPEPSTPDAAAAAEEAVISSPEQPRTYSNQWVDVQPGEWHWYAFKFDFDDSSDDEQGSATIRLDANPVDGATLTLVNKEQVNAWQHGEKLQGFGAATPATERVEQKTRLRSFCNIYPNDPACTGGDRSTSMCENLHNPASPANACRYATTVPRGYGIWSGVIESSGTYYILVRGNPRVAGPIQYKFTTGGEGLTMK
jgi:hypothetical protein